MIELPMTERPASRPSFGGTRSTPRTCSLSPGRGRSESATESVTALRRDLMRALAQLPRSQRAVVVLRYFEDLSVVQTAETLGCSVGTVKGQCARALAAMRRSPSLANEGVRDV